ncbi:MAG: cytochrome c biogenesis protein CcsA [Bacteroidaceae bacterium]|nr:cytochrome c biogenesis protein CcsA [Bacteroidaceae bacterium]
MSWDVFYIYAVVSVVSWGVGAFFAFRNSRKNAIVATALGSLVFFVFIAGLWAALQRPPLRTMGETRLWYSFFLSLIGLFLYVKYKYSWMLGFGALMSLVFVAVNLLKPEIHSVTLMPALQSPWFVPHVIVYMFSYAMMGAATIYAGYLWFGKSPADVSEKEFAVCDNLVRIGWAFLTLGMIMGALWAKEAWGDYWTWDPKETWAFATWLSYLLYLHLRPANKNQNLLFALLLFSFILLQMCWWGINFLPSAQGTSIHTY